MASADLAAIPKKISYAVKLVVLVIARVHQVLVLMVNVLHVQIQFQVTIVVDLPVQKIVTVCHRLVLTMYVWDVQVQTSSVMGLLVLQILIVPQILV